MRSFILILAILTPILGLRVLESVHELGRPAGISGATLAEPAGKVVTRDLTVCLRFNTKTLSGSDGRVVPFSIGKNYDGDEYKDSSRAFAPDLFWISLVKTYSFFGFGFPRLRGSYKSYIMEDVDDHGIKELITANRWTHFCLAYKRDDGTVTVMRNGKIVAGGIPDPEMTQVEISEDLLSMINLGKAPHFDQNAASTPELEIADLNVWSRPLSRDELRAWTTCRSFDKGDLVNWDETELNLINMTLRDESPDLVCSPIVPGHTIIPNKRPFDALRSVCRQFNARVSVVESEEVQDELAEKFGRHDTECNRLTGHYLAFYNGWWDRPTEGNFTDVNTDEAIGDFQPWFLGEPNGGFAENCGVAWPQEKSWNDAECDQLLCGFCKLEEVPVFTLRGLCEKTVFDTKYSWTDSLEKDFYVLRGNANSILRYLGEGEWRIQLYDDDKAFISALTPDYPFGLMEWTVTNDNCHENETVSMMLNLNACNDSEFNCDNGQCVPMDERCNGVINCEDKTDEVNCVVYEKDFSYLSQIPPESVAGANITAVSLELDVLAVLDISEVDSVIAMQTEMHLSWFDARLTMIDLNEEAALNFLSLESRKEIWLPEVVFYNTEIKSETLNDEKAFATVLREGNYRRRGKNFLQNAYIYKGEENPLKLSRVYSSKFLCDYDMAVYPFDKQECFATFTMKGKFDKFVKLTAKNVSYLGPIDLTQYFVMGTEIQETTVPPGVNAIQVKISFGRRILSTILSSYFPTAIICMLTFCTNYFRGFYFEAVVTVNLTSMLALTTLFVGIFASLPQTAYIKMMDIWLIFCLTIPFLEVILQTYLEYLRGETEDAVLVNHHGIIDVETDHQALRRRTRSPKRNRIEVIPDADGQMSKKKEGKHYQRAEMKIRATRMLLKWGLPIYFLSFAVLYFVVGFAIKA